MENLKTESYDDILYPSYSHSQTHPDRLAVLARLFGMTPAPVEHCRVLELGCGDGGNLIPMAFALPGSHFTGIDRAKLPIEKGERMIAALNLTNVALRSLDLLDLPTDLGKFDYVIAHGLYSWVPDAVRDRILEICKTHLSEQGVAFISYNTYPGGHVREMVREMMLFHVRHYSEPQQRINQALALLKFLGSAKKENDTYAQLLKDELDKNLQFEPSLLYHDQLSNINTSAYFHEFIEHAARHELKFVSEADFFEMQFYVYSPETVEVLQGLASESTILKEQYLDFMKCRRFRQTLLCHSSVQLNPEADPKVVTDMYLASVARPENEEPDLRPKVVEEFVAEKGARVATDHPLAKAALTQLARIYPLRMHFSDLLAAARDRTKREGVEGTGGSGDEIDTLAEIFLQIYSTGALELFPRAADFVTHVSERPKASPVARYQIEQGPVVTNMRLTRIEVEGGVGQQLLRLLDGTRDHETMLDNLTEKVKSGVARLAVDNQPISDPEQIRQVISSGLEKNLVELANMALLIG